jgi:PAS domain S-box-containing protein
MTKIKNVGRLSVPAGGIPLAAAVGEEEEPLSPDVSDEESKMQEMIQPILDSVEDGLVVTGFRNRIVWLNRAAEELLGIKASTALGRPLSRIIRDRAFLEQFQGVSIRRIEGGKKIDLEFAMPGSNPPRVIRARMSRLRNPQGKLAGVVTRLQDVTRERELDRSKCEFISTVAHELRTPLTSLMGYAELLMSPEEFGGFDSEQQREFLSEIYQKGEYLARITNEFLDAGRIDAGRMPPLEKAPCHLEKLLRKVVAHFENHAPRHRFELCLPSSPWGESWCDWERILQVVENILSNAVKYSPDGGWIRISGGWISGDLRVSVADQGIGMTREQVDRVFDAFYRADASDTAVGGLGLGMSIARGIVEAHGGRIWVESEPDRGTKVFFTLPPATAKI